MNDDTDLTSVEPVPRLALRLREAAQALGVSERTLGDWVKRGDVPHVKRGGTVLFSVDVLREWMRQQTSDRV